jgi:ketosteroid isomerase-like protein
VQFTRINMPTVLLSNIAFETAVSYNASRHTHREVRVKTAESNKALVRRFYEEIDKGNIDILDELVAEDYTDHNPPPFPDLAPGREGLKQAFRIFQRATPGYHRIEEQIAEGDKVMTRLTSIGKHEGDLPGAPRTGNELQMTSITIHRIANGQLVEKWAEKDVMGFLRQIGVLPGMPPH